MTHGVDDCIWPVAVIMRICGVCSSFGCGFSRMGQGRFVRTQQPCIRTNDHPIATMNQHSNLPIYEYYALGRSDAGHEGRRLGAR